MKTLALLGSLLIVLFVVATLFVFTRSRPLEGPPVEGPPVEGPPVAAVPGSDAAAHDLPASSGDVRKRAVPATDRASEELAIDPAEEVGSLPAEGIVLRGTVRWSDDGAPAPHLRLVAHGAGGVRFAVISDEAGEFVSEPVLGAGRLRLRQMGEAPRPAGVARYPRGVRFAPDVFVVPEGATGFEVELLLERPARRLLVEVHDRSARPVEGAAVSLETLVQSGGGAEHDLRSQTTDRDGIAAFALYEVERIQALGVLAVLSDAEGSGPASVSDFHALELPLHSGSDVRERLVLDDAARLLVRTVDESGMPVVGHWVWLQVDQELFAWLPEGGVTDAEGELRFDALPPGTYGVGAETGPGRDHEQVEVMRGVERELEIVIPGGAERLAASGVVLDEKGAPLPGAMVTVLYGPRVGPGDTMAAGVTDEEGRFEFHAAPCEGLTVLLDGGLQGDEFSPASTATSFGDRDLVFRRTRRFPDRELDLELVGAETGERVERAIVMTVRSPGTEGYDFRSTKGGLLTLVVSEHPDVRLVVDSAGYRRRSVALQELEPTEPGGRLHRVTLEPGLLRSIEVHGEPEGGGEETKLAGAEIWDGTRRVGVTDAEGRLTLDLRCWPTQPLRVEARGHLPESWSPTDAFGEPGPASIWLEPAR